MESNNLKHLSTGEPIYWRFNRNKLPDLVDFCVAKSWFNLSSDHSPILITLTADALNQQNEPTLSNTHTNWHDFRRLVKERLTLDIPL
jgi:hypothetical protein